MRIGIYPGSFDPITNGHIDIIKRALQVVGVLIVSVLKNKEKKNMFTTGERIEFIRQALDESIDDPSVFDFAGGCPCSSNGHDCTTGTGTGTEILAG